MKIKLIADSACSIPKDVAEKYDIEVVPLGIIFGNEQFKDGATITDEEFFERQVNGGITPTTSQINQYEWGEVFKKFLDDYDYIAVVTLSSKMSGTNQSAHNAAKELGAVDKIHIYDSFSVSIPSGLIAFEIARMIERGASIEEIDKKAPVLIEKADVKATFDSLKYLRDGGRLSNMAAFIGTMLKVKVILSTKDGLVHASEKVVSTKKTLKRIKEIVREEADLSMPIFFGEAAYKEKALEFAREYQEELGISDWALAPIGCTVGVHTGPKSFGVAYFRK
ncbi:MAG: DegV family protein [Bacillota bacterium]